MNSFSPPLINSFGPPLRPNIFVGLHELRLRSPASGPEWRWRRLRSPARARRPPGATCLYSVPIPLFPYSPILPFAAASPAPPRSSSAILPCSPLPFPSRDSAVLLSRCQPVMRHQPKTSTSTTAGALPCPALSDYPQQGASGPTRRGTFVLPTCSLLPPRPLTAKLFEGEVDGRGPWTSPPKRLPAAAAAEPGADDRHLQLDTHTAEPGAGDRHLQLDTHTHSRAWCR